ncbi:MAG: YHS domain-containing protein [Actinobacteria bacterium]|nr:YHS domain-containing protein [Actinomycetota bacterium]MTB04486.1 YHS domain-containing protein [Actinomycetota bacterium]
MFTVCLQYGAATKYMSFNPVEGMGVMERAVELTNSGESFVMATVVWRQGPSSGQSGSRAIITSDGKLHGWIGGACAEPVLIREAKKVMDSGKAQLIWLGQEVDFKGMHVPDGVITVPMACQSEGALQIYVEPVQSSPQVMIVGRSPMAVTLKQLIDVLNWRVQIVDFADFTMSMINSSTAVIVATQGHGDEEATEIALPAAPAYLGVVASRKRGAAVLSYLEDRGFSKTQIDTVNLPAGLDLGHTTHREMAVSILAQLVQLRAAGSLTQKATPQLLQMVQATEVIDLVCGMTVTAEKSNRPFEFEGTVYYFCAPGCRTAFEKDPTSFINQEAKC